MAEGQGTTTKDVLEAFLALKDQPLTTANTRAALYRLEEELIRQTWNIMAHYDNQFYLTSSMSKIIFFSIPVDEHNRKLF